MSADQLEWRYCAECAQDRAFEEPDCTDGPGDACTELACTACGTGLTFAQQPTRLARFVADAAA